MRRIIWNGNTAHGEAHGLTVEDVEHVDRWTIYPTACEVDEPMGRKR